MKTILSLLILAASALAQSITIPDIDNTGMSLPLTISSSGFVDLIAWISGTPPVAGLWPNTSIAPVNTTLAAAITTTTGSCSGVTGASVGANCTTVTLTSATNLAQCNGLVIDNEVMVIASVSGNTVVVIRGMIGTTKATHLNGASVTISRVGDGTCQLKADIADATSRQVLAKCTDSVCAAAAANIASNTATENTTAVGAIQ